MARHWLPVIAALLLPAPAAGQADPDRREPRVPVLLGLTRTERLEAAVSVYLSDLLGAVRRGDTTALAVLVPDTVVPGAEKPVAASAGCPSLGSAAERLRSTRAATSPNPDLPLGALRLGPPSITITAGDTVAHVRVRLSEHQPSRTLFGPLEILFREADEAWSVALVRGVLVTLCGLGEHGS